VSNLEIAPSIEFLTVLKTALAIFTRPSAVANALTDEVAFCPDSFMPENPFLMSLPNCLNEFLAVLNAEPILLVNELIVLAADENAEPILLPSELAPDATLENMDPALDPIDENADPIPDPNELIFEVIVENTDPTFDPIVEKTLIIFCPTELSSNALRMRLPKLPNKVMILLVADCTLLKIWLMPVPIFDANCETACCAL